jgi:hypothetical protein
VRYVVKKRPDPWLLTFAYLKYRHSVDVQSSVKLTPLCFWIGSSEYGNDSRYVYVFITDLTESGQFCEELQFKGYITEPRAAGVVPAFTEVVGAVSTLPRRIGWIEIAEPQPDEVIASEPSTTATNGHSALAHDAQEVALVG